MAKGNPNPSPETRFKPGSPGNPGGKTAAQKKREMQNAERATRLRGRLLDALEKSLDAALAEDPDQRDTAAVSAIQADVLRLLKDSEDRGLGSPTVPMEHTGAGGGAIKHEIGADAAFAELASLMGGIVPKPQSGDNSTDGVAQDSPP